MPEEQPNRRILFALALLCLLALTLPGKAQEQAPEDPENEKQVGLWLDQAISIDRSPNRSLEFEVHELFDNGASNLFEYFFQGGIAFRLRPWLTVPPPRIAISASRAIPTSHTRTACCSTSL